jgi:hypothetical protein
MADKVSKRLPDDQDVDSRARLCRTKGTDTGTDTGTGTGADTDTDAGTVADTDAGTPDDL